MNSLGYHLRGIAAFFDQIEADGFTPNPDLLEIIADHCDVTARVCLILAAEQRKEAQPAWK